jgi:glycosyltransferase involved in cell wall biosynthesis
MEAMASGCAVVASKVGGNPELVADGETGLLFECGNAGRLAERILTLIDRPDLRERLGQCASRRIAAEFTIEKSARRMEGIYMEFLNRR